MKLPTLFPSETRNQGSARGGFLYVIAIILIAIFALIMINIGKREGGMESPVISMVKRVVRLETPIPVLSSNPKAVLKTFTFGASADLKQELDTVNPQVLDNDFSD